MFDNSVNNFHGQLYNSQRDINF